MSSTKADLERALDRLGEILRAQAPDVWQSLRPGVSEPELDVLRAAVSPRVLSYEVAQLFRWANGQERGAAWWPVLECGSLLSAGDAAAKYRSLLAHSEPWQWSAAWVPIAHGGWHQAGVEIDSNSPGVVIDASFPEPPRVIAPTLAVLLEVTADMIQAGIAAPVPGENAVRWRQKRAGLLDARPEWRSWRRDRDLGTDVTRWPRRWRAVGRERGNGRTTAP